MPYPVEGFLLADPFVALMTLLSTHTVYRALWWSVGMVALTLVFGRVFCGWICPFGTLHHFFAWLLPNPKRRHHGRRRVRANMTHPYQNVKYYLLGAFLVAAVCGSAIGGLFDPICIACGPSASRCSRRSTTSRAAGSTPSPQTNVHALQTGADATRDALVATVLQPRQYFFHQTWVIGGCSSRCSSPTAGSRASGAARCARSARPSGVIARTPSSAWRRTTPSAPTATSASSTARAPTARRAA
jgi:hypothetical protein